MELEMHMDEYLPLRDVVFNTLRAAILKGELKPGEKMNSAVKKYFEGKGYQCVAEDIADTIGDKYDTWDCYQTPSGVGLAVSSDATQIIMTIAG